MKKYKISIQGNKDGVILEFDREADRQLLTEALLASNTPIIFHIWETEFPVAPGGFERLNYRMYSHQGY